MRLVHSKNWSVKHNSWSVIFNTSQKCEEGQHSECYTNTSGGVAILTLRKCYRYLTIRSVALTLPEGCFNTLVNVALTLPEGCCDTLVTPSTGRTDTYAGCFDIFHGYFENWRSTVKHYSVLWTLCRFRVTHCKRFYNTRRVHCVGSGITVNSKRSVQSSHSDTGRLFLWCQYY